MKPRTKKQKEFSLKRKIIDESYQYERVTGDEEDKKKVLIQLKKYKKLFNKVPKGYEWYFQ